MSLRELSALDLRAHHARILLPRSARQQHSREPQESTEWDCHHGQTWDAVTADGRSPSCAVGATRNAVTYPETPETVACVIHGAASVPRLAPQKHWVRLQPHSA